VLLALRAALDLGVDMGMDCFEHDVDLGAPFVPLARDFAQVFSTVLTEADLGDLDGFHRVGIGRIGPIEPLALAVASALADGAVILGGLR